MMRDGSGIRWTFRSWLLPWTQIALASGFAASRSPALPVLLCVAVLAAVPFLSGPVAHRRSASWTVLVVCGLWWGASAVSGSAIQGYYQLLRIGGWCLVLLGALQILSLGRGGSAVLVAWCSLGATWLFSGRWGTAGVVALAVQAVLAVESIRRIDAPAGAGAKVVARWCLILGLLAGIVALQRAWRGSWSWNASSNWGDQANRIRGFSVVSRLGTFGPWYRPDREGEVALRVWTARSPGLLKGMVHDLYSNGSWVSTMPSKWRSYERMHLEFGQFCRDLSDTAAPSAWASSPDDRIPVLFAPPGTGCVGVVADSLKLSMEGVFLPPPDASARGWFWYGRDVVDTLADPHDLKVPPALGGLLDSAWREIGDSVARLSPPLRVDAIGRWFARGFRYDLDVPVDGSNEPLRSFFRHRRGYCEYFATSAVLLLRRSGIPARYVTGFSDPEPVAGGRWWLYRQGGAHAWVEWLPVGGNWTVFDPTPPDDRPKPDRSDWEVLTERVNGWTRRAWHVVRDGIWRERLDAWQTGLESVPWAAWFSGVAGLALGAWLFVRKKDAGRVRRGAWEQELGRIETLLRRRGHVRLPGETVGAFLRRLPLDVDPNALRSLRAYQRERWRLK